MAKFETHVIIIALLAAANFVVADEECSSKERCRDRTAALHLKFGAIASILTASVIGVCLPIVGQSFKALQPDQDVFFVIKAFAAGVILATGFVHILPDAFEDLSSECLKENPWHKFPFAGFVAMMVAVCSLIIDAGATGYYERERVRKQQPTVSVEQSGDREMGVTDSHNHSHGHAHGIPVQDSGSSLIRHRVISQVLELGIVAHSVIIGISMGASGSPCTIRPLIAALTFHQFFEGIGLGGCIVQAAFSRRSTAIMAFFFSVTTPFGIALGIAILSAYNENSPKALIIEGLFDAASAGILIYMSLVDLLAPQFLNKRMHSNVALQVWSYASLLLGIGAMSLIAKWA